MSYTSILSYSFISPRYLIQLRVLFFSLQYMNTAKSWKHRGRFGFDFWFVFPLFCEGLLWSLIAYSVILSQPCLILEATWPQACTWMAGYQIFHKHWLIGKFKKTWQKSVTAHFHNKIKKNGLGFYYALYSLLAVVGKASHQKQGVWVWFPL